MQLIEEQIVFTCVCNKNVLLSSTWTQLKETYSSLQFNKTDIRED